MSRYNRHLVLEEIGPDGQAKINAAKVLVVGAGGLGCPALQYLTAAGVGTIGIADGDTVERSNLQRQVLYGSSVLGKNKAQAAKKRLEDLNDEITLIAYPENLNPHNIATLLQPYDIIVDGTDNIASRYLISDACVVLNKPLVYAAIYKFEGQVSVFNYRNGPSYRCAFPYSPKEKTVPNCAEIGVLGVLPGIMGCLQANETLKIILGIDRVLTGVVYCYHALTHRSYHFKLIKNNAEVERVKARGLNFANVTDYGVDGSCSEEVEEITLAEIAMEKNIQFVDVRELSEEPKIAKEKALKIPLSTLTSRLAEVSEEKKTVVFCQSGVRSKKAVALLKKRHKKNCYSLKGGIDAFSATLSK